MNYSKIKPLDIANGEGIRVSLFVSGCPHHCKGCFNPETWDYNYGEYFGSDTVTEIIELMNHDYIAGLSLLGGEPFAQGDKLLGLLSKAKLIYPYKNIWAYSGYTFEDLVEKKHPMLSWVDVLVDGLFIEDLKNPSLQFRGSSNQRIIDVQESFGNGEVVLWEPQEVK